MTTKREQGRSLDYWCRRVCEQLGITRQKGSPIFAALVDAVSEENERCQAAAARALVSLGSSSEALNAVRQALEPEPLYDEPHGSRSPPNPCGRNRGRAKYLGSAEDR